MANSRYPNMSYCMCENTLAAMQQIIEHMQEEGVGFLNDMSREERRAFGELFSTCEDFMNMSEELEAEAERESEYDGQPSEYDEWQSYDEDC